jgi:hypothetical protein
VTGKIKKAYKLDLLTNFWMFQIKPDFPVVYSYDWNVSCFSKNTTLNKLVVEVFADTIDRMFNQRRKEEPYKYIGIYEYDNNDSRCQVYKNPILQRKLKTMISEAFKNRRSKWMQDTMFFEDNKKRLVLFDACSDCKKFNFEIREHEGKKIVFVSRKQYQNEGLAFDIENGNTIGYIKFNK